LLYARIAQKSALLHVFLLERSVYIPASFNENDQATLHDFMRAHSFATVVTTHDSKPFASHLPLFLDGTSGPQGALIGHMARANLQWQEMQAGAEVLVMFHGPHAYVSPAWYEAQAMVVPTWNYMAVHAYGKARILSQEELEQALHKLVDSYEGAYEQPWQLEMSQSMREKMLGAIVGFEIALSSIEGKFKLSQNRSEQDRQRVTAKLAEQDDAGSRSVAEQMGKYSGEN
jgi:transcriptional regulator